MIQESRGHCSKITTKLASFKGNNASRDFHRWIKLPLEAWCDWSRFSILLFFLSGSFLEYLLMREGNENSGAPLGQSAYPTTEPGTLIQP